MKIDDWIYSIEVLANKDYEGAYYPSVENIQGAKDYHEGKADHINGLKKIDDYTMQVTFDKKQENYLTGFITGPLLSKKYLSDVPIKDLAKSDKIRKYPIGDHIKLRKSSQVRLFNLLNLMIIGKVSLH